MKRFLAHGIGVHHAGLLPKYRLLVEKLAQRGLLAIVSGTDTLGVGVNIPIRTVLFTRLCKFDGEKTAILERARVPADRRARGAARASTIAGLRRRRRRPSTSSRTCASRAKAGDDPAKLKRIVRKKPPERGYVHWDRVDVRPARAPRSPSRWSRASASRTACSSRCSSAKGRLQRAGAHHPPLARATRAAAHLRPRGDGDVRGALGGGHRSRSMRDTRQVRVHVDLQEDFSLHHALSLWLIDTLPRLDRESPTYALDVLTLVESILEDPEYVLRQQLDALKTREGRRAEGGGRRVRGAHGRAREARVPQAAPRVRLRHVQRVRAHAPVGEGRRRPPEVHRARDGRAVHGLQRVRARVRAGPRRGHAAALPERRLQDARPDGAGAGEDAGGRRDRAVPARHGARRSTRACSTSGSASATPRPRSIGAGCADAGSARRDRRHDATRRRSRSSCATSCSRSCARWRVATGRQRRSSWTAAAPFPFEEAFAPFFAEHAAVRLDPSARAPSKTVITHEPAAWRVVQVVSDPEGDDDWASELRDRSSRLRGGGQTDRDDHAALAIASARLSDGGVDQR